MSKGKMTSAQKNKIIFSIVSWAIRLVILIVVLILLINGGKAAHAFGKAVTLDAPMTGEDNAREITVTIPENPTAKEVGNILESRNLIKDANVFFVQSFLVGEGRTLKGGQYELDTSMSAKEMMKIIGAVDVEDEE